MVPIPVIKLNETHSALRQATRQQAVGREGARLFCVLAIQLESVGRLFRNVGELRHGGLHPKRHLILSNACMGFRVTESIRFHLVQLAQRIQKMAPSVSGASTSNRKKVHWIA